MTIATNPSMNTPTMVITPIIPAMMPVSGFLGGGLM
jgi:hypothetical protein